MTQKFTKHQQLLNLIIVCLLAPILIASCGRKSALQTEPTSTSAQDKSKAAADLSADDDIPGLDSSDSVHTGKDGAPKEEKKKLSTAIKKTGKMVDGLVLQQHNEMLGATTMKICKLGARLDSNFLTIIMLPGKGPQAYNAQNGSTMELSAKSAAMMTGTQNRTGPIETVTNLLGKEKIAGVNCTHYNVEKFEKNPRSKRHRERVWYADVWSTKELPIPESVLKATSLVMVIPPELGFPLRVARFNNPTEKEKARGERGHSVMRDVITTSSCVRTKIDQGEFARLEGFKPVKNEMELMMTESDSDLASSSDLDDTSTSGSANTATATGAAKNR